MLRNYKNIEQKIDIFIIEMCTTMTANITALRISLQKDERSPKQNLKHIFRVIQYINKS